MLVATVQQIQGTHLPQPHRQETRSNVRDLEKPMTEHNLFYTPGARILRAAGFSNIRHSTAVRLNRRANVMAWTLPRGLHTFKPTTDVRRFWIRQRGPDSLGRPPNSILNFQGSRTLASDVLIESLNRLPGKGKHA
jgi:hypothetical protein